MVPPPLEGFDMWTLLWRVCITDFILKYACIISKAAVTLTPISMISYKSKVSWRKRNTSFIVFNKLVGRNSNVNKGEMLITGIYILLNLVFFEGYQVMTIDVHNLSLRYNKLFIFNVAHTLR